MDWSCPIHDRLHNQFDWSVGGVQRGEATPIYIYWPHALERLQRYHPGARLIVVLRHPTWRAWSHWRMEVTRKKEFLSFQEAVSAVGRCRVAEAPNGAHRVYSYVERGFYGAQIRQLLSFFPRPQVHFCRTDELWTDAAGTLCKIWNFLGVTATVPEFIEPHYIVPLQSTVSSEMPSSVRAELDDLYASEIVHTSQLTGLDLSDWLKPDYHEPMVGSL